MTAATNLIDLFLAFADRQGDEAAAIKRSAIGRIRNALRQTHAGGRPRKNGNGNKPEQLAEQVSNRRTGQQNQHVKGMAPQLCYPDWTPCPVCRSIEMSPEEALRHCK